MGPREKVHVKVWGTVQKSGGRRGRGEKISSWPIKEKGEKEKKVEMDWKCAGKDKMGRRKQSVVYTGGFMILGCKADTLPSLLP